jgi:hypothetical protein
MELTSTDPTPRLGNSTALQANFGNASTQDMFPPVCLTYHWDPTAVLRRVVPQGPQVPMALDPRPWTKVCLEYVNSGQSSEQAPLPPNNMVFPSGGEFYPPGRYSNAIDNESLLRRLDRPLGTCDNYQYEPNMRGDMYKPNVLVPDRVEKPSTDMVKELAMPRALLRAGPYDCRLEADKVNWSRSTSLFHNATKQQRYNQGFATKQLKPNQAQKMQ